jgi:nucleoside 2-deoxyribosyltransferase
MSSPASLTVVGGVYRERVRHPRREELFGSGGRAAATTATLGVTTRLCTAIDRTSLVDFNAIAGALEIDLEVTEITRTTEFLYDHPLGTPRIRPMFGSIRLPMPLAIKSDCALVFGMIEGQTRIVSSKVVYDPQNPLAPEWFDESGSEAEDVVYVLNRQEGRVLTQREEATAIVEAILARPGVAGCALKLGPWGAVVGERGGGIHRIPCYETMSVWPIGSGDVFAATIAWAWLVQGLDIREAGEAASRATALYAASGAIPGDIDTILGRVEMPYPAVPVKEREGRREHDVYLAGPFFALQDQWLVEEVRDVLQSFGLNVFSPLHDVGPGEASEVAPRDLKAVADSATVMALLDRLDPGTLFEVGYARALEIPVVAHVHGIPEGHLKMIEGSQCLITEDLATAIYKVAWETRRE